MCVHKLGMVLNLGYRLQTWDAYFLLGMTFFLLGMALFSVEMLGKIEILLENVNFEVQIHVCADTVLHFLWNGSWFWGNFCGVIQCNWKIKESLYTVQYLCILFHFFSSSCAMSEPGFRQYEVNVQNLFFSEIRPRCGILKFFKFRRPRSAWGKGGEVCENFSDISQVTKIIVFFSFFAKFGFRNSQHFLTHFQKTFLENQNLQIPPSSKFRAEFLRHKIIFWMWQISEIRTSKKSKSLGTWNLKK